MNENKNITDESVEYTEEIVVEKELNEEVLDDSIEESEREVIVEPIKKESRRQKTIRLIAQAKEIVKEANDKSAECKLLLADDLAEYEDAKLNLKEHGYDACTALLESTGYRSSFDAPIEKEAVVFEAKDEDKPMVIKNLSSGKFSALVYSLIAGGATAVGLVYVATEKLGMTLNVAHLPSAETTEKIASWFSTLVGMEPDYYVGAGVFGLSIVTVMVLVYALRVGLKTSTNLHYAVKKFVEAELYAEKKADCQEEFEKLDAHMKESIKTFKTYEVLFNEQQGKLKRITHLEGEKSDVNEYHHKSLIEIEETHKLAESIKDFMAVSMSKEGKLSEDSVERLEKLKKDIDDMIERLY